MAGTRQPKRLGATITTKRVLAAEKAVLAELLPEAFALVREAGDRTIGLRHFDVQIIGGAALHEGTITEMRTGEGKTSGGDGARLSQCA